MSEPPQEEVSRGYFAISDITIERMTIKPIATATICWIRRLRISRLDIIAFFAI
jgi:hypothetical protein